MNPADELTEWARRRQRDELLRWKLHVEVARAANVPLVIDNTGALLSAEIPVGVQLTNGGEILWLTDPRDDLDDMWSPAFKELLGEAFDAGWYTALSELGDDDSVPYSLVAS